MCDCPLCPLIESNTQLCDVLIRYSKKDFALKMPFKHANTPAVISKAIGRLAYTVLTSHDLLNKQKIGDSCDLEQETYEFFMKRVMKNVWKVCFHTKKIETNEDPS